jgi:hypothetical protein
MTKQIRFILSYNFVIHAKKTYDIMQSEKAKNGTVHFSQNNMDIIERWIDGGKSLHRPLEKKEHHEIFSADKIFFSFIEYLLQKFNRSNTLKCQLRLFNIGTFCEVRNVQIMNKKWANFICKYVSSGPRFLIC